MIVSPDTIGKTGGDSKTNLRLGKVIFHGCHRRSRWSIKILLPMFVALASLLGFYILPTLAFQSPDQELVHGDYQTAIASFKQTLQSNPGDRSAQAGLLQAYLETGKYSEAETAAKQFLSKGFRPEGSFLSRRSLCRDWSL